MLTVLYVFFWRMSFFYYIFFERERAEPTPGRRLPVLSVSFCNVTKGWFLKLEKVREVTDGLFSSPWSSPTAQIFGKHLAAAATWSHQTPRIPDLLWMWRFTHYSCWKKMQSNILTYFTSTVLVQRAGFLLHRGSIPTNQKPWIFPCDPSWLPMTIHAKPFQLPTGVAQAS